MIYFATDKNRQGLPEDIHIIDAKQSIDMIGKWPVVQFDTETTGLDCHVDNLLSLQFGYDDDQVVVDCSCYSPLLYKEILEDKLIIGANLKFDIKFLYNYNIIPKSIYDVMISEQVFYIGYKGGEVSFNLHDIVLRNIGIKLDKTYQQQIAFSGLTERGIRYAAYDVKYLQAVRDKQLLKAKARKCEKALLLENQAVLPVAYLEWCGIHLDADKWLVKMDKDRQKRDNALSKLNHFVKDWGKAGYVSDSTSTQVPKEWFSNMTYTTGLGDLFTGNFDTTLHCTINWDSSKQATAFLKKLGFDTSTKDKDTGEDKDSVLMKKLEKQRGVCDEFLDAYLTYKKAGQDCKTFGQSYLNAINPNTGMLHTEFRQIGTDTGRFACGSAKKINSSLARLKGLPVNPGDNTDLKCSYPQLQNLPHDPETRACFTAPEGYLMCACDYSSIEQRLAADIYNDKAMIEEYKTGSGDIHSLVAQLIFPELKGLTTAEIKKNHKDKRTRAKPVGLGINYGAAAPKLAETIGCSKETAQSYYDAYMNHFIGVRDYMKKADKFVKDNGYIVICEETGHKAYWPDWGTWKAESMKYTKEFWEQYKQYHKGTGDAVAQEVKRHMQRGSAWSRKAVNSPCQGLSAVITKCALIKFFKWIVKNNLFGEVRIVDAVHDEIVITFPESMKDTVPKILKETMEEVGNHFCKKVEIVAEAETAPYWVH